MRYAQCSEQSVKDAALELVRNERRIELAAEGHRYDDIRRYGLEYCREAMNGESTAPCGGFDPVKKNGKNML